MLYLSSLFARGWHYRHRINPIVCFLFFSSFSRVRVRRLFLARTSGTAVHDVFLAPSVSRYTPKSNRCLQYAFVIPPTSLALLVS